MNKPTLDLMQSSLQTGLDAFKTGILLSANGDGHENTDYEAAAVEFRTARQYLTRSIRIVDVELSREKPVSYSIKHYANRSEVIDNTDKVHFIGHTGSCLDWIKKHTAPKPDYHVQEYAFHSEVCSAGKVIFSGTNLECLNWITEHS